MVVTTLNSMMFNEKVLNYSNKHYIPLTAITKGVVSIKPSCRYQAAITAVTKGVVDIDYTRRRYIKLSPMITKGIVSIKPRQYIKAFNKALLIETSHNDVLKIPTGNLLSNKEGQIDCIIMPLRNPGSTNQYIFDGNGQTNRNLELLIKTNGSICARYGTGNTTLELTSQNPASKDYPYKVTVKWNLQVVSLIVNGNITSREGEHDIAFGNELYVGCNKSGKSQLDGVMDDFRLSVVARSDEDIIEMHNDIKPFPVDEWTTYKLNFDNTLLPAYDDITEDLGLTTIDAACYNKSDWLISGDTGKVKKYDGSTVTDLTAEFNLSGKKINAIEYGTYWLVAGQQGLIKKYDNSSVVDLTASFEFGSSDINTLAWSGLYWLVAGKNGKIKKYDGTVTDLTNDFKFGSETITCIKWSGAYFLIGGTNGKIKKYDGATVTDLTADFDLGTATVNAIQWNGDYFLVATSNGKIKKYDGKDVTDLSSHFNISTGIKYLSYNGTYWLVSVDNGKILKYENETVTDITDIINLGGSNAPVIYHSEYYLINNNSKTIKFYYLPETYTYSWYSPAIDVSNTTDKNSGHAAVNASLPGGTMLVIKSRSSDDGVIWSDWFAASSDGDLRHPGANFIQVVVQLKTYGARKPVFDSVTISFDGVANTTLLASDFSEGGQFYMDTLLDNLVIVNGIDIPRKYDGEEISILEGNPPQAAFIAAHKNRLFMAKDSRLYFSELLDIETWPVLNFIDISPNDGDVINGLIVYGDYLVIAKKHSIWMLSGEGPSTFMVKRIHSDKGVYAPRSLIVVDGNLCFVANDGIYLSDLTQTVLISERIRKYWESLNPRRIKQAASYYTENKLYVSVAEGSSLINNSVIVFDTLRQAFTGIRSGWNVNCWLKFYEADKKISLFGHSNIGQVSEINTGYSDNGDVYYSVWKSKEFDFGSGESYKRWNRVYLDVKPSMYDSTLEIAFYVDGKYVGNLTVDIPKGNGDEVYSILTLASKAGVIGGRRMSLEVKQAVKDNPVGIQRVAIEFISRGTKPTFYGW